MLRVLLPPLRQTAIDLIWDTAFLISLVVNDSLGLVYWCDLPARKLQDELLPLRTKIFAQEWKNVLWRKINKQQINKYILTEINNDLPSSQTDWLSLDI